MTCGPQAAANNLIALSIILLRLQSVAPRRFVEFFFCPCVACTRVASFVAALLHMRLFVWLAQFNTIPVMRGVTAFQMIRTDFEQLALHRAPCLALFSVAAPSKEKMLLLTVPAMHSHACCLQSFACHAGRTSCRDGF